MVIVKHDHHFSDTSSESQPKVSRLQEAGYHVLTDVYPSSEHTFIELSLEVERYNHREGEYHNESHDKGLSELVYVQSDGVEDISQGFR